MSAPATRQDEVSAPYLFSLDQLPAEACERLEQREQTAGDWTAERLRRYDLRLYNAVARLLAIPSLSQRFISEICGVSVNTVRAVFEEKPPSMTDFRERLGTRRRLAMDRCVEVIAAGIVSDSKEGVGKAYQAAIVLNILDGQERLDSGAPTARIEVTGVPAEEEFRRFLQARMIEAGEADVTGITRGAPLQKEPPGDSADDPAPTVNGGVP